MGIAGDQLNCIARTEFTLLDHGEVETGSSAVKKSFDYVVATEFYGQLVTRKTRLRYDKLGGADSKAVSDVDPALEQSFRAQVLAKHSPGQVDSRQLKPPVIIVLGRVSVDCLVYPAVNLQIGLPVAIEVQGSKSNRAFNRIFEYAGSDQLPIRDDFAGKPDIQR